MSLDIYLIDMNPASDPTPVEDAIYVRTGGQTRKVLREMWNLIYPNKEPIVVRESTKTVFETNITHNLTEMAKQVGLYEALWHPEDMGATKAGDLRLALISGYAILLMNRELCEQYEPSNGWGTYLSLCDAVSDYKDACIKYPDAIIETSL